MKKLTVLILIALFLTISYSFLRNDNAYKVLKVDSATDFYVDFNRNQVAEENELVQMFDMDSEPEDFSQVENARLTYLSKNFAKKILLIKKVKIILNPKTKVMLQDGKDYADFMIKEGYFLSENNINEVKSKLESAKTLNLVSYNPHSLKYHTLECKYAFKALNEQIMQKNELPKNVVPCKFCHLQNTKQKNLNSEIKEPYPRDVYEKYQPVYRDSALEFYVMDFTKYYYPSSKCLTTACKALLREINTSKTSIDFAVYGVDRQPEISSALINAQNRGVKIRWIYDVDKSGKTIYLETFKLKKSLQDAKSDMDCTSDMLPNGKRMRDSIMHNKFFIFDSKKVWTGSANITHTDLSGFNANAVALINSPAVAKIYEEEFLQMYNGKFHQMKSPTAENINAVGKSQISVYFSPQDKIVSKQIIPLINNAKKYVYVPVFVITHKDFNQALIDAKNRGVDVKIIVDATSASNKYSSVSFLRENGLKIKTENRTGKMHMKSIIIDDEYVVMGSMNFTKSGESYNDENVLIVKNSVMAKSFKSKFLYFYNEIPDKWLNKNPGAESWNSINSCFDGVDNDFDGKVDMEDDSCNFKLKSKKN